MIIDESQFHRHDIAKLVKGTVVPRAIAWVSSISKKGTPNLAPYSFFTVASLDPIIFCFSVGPRSTVNQPTDKDTLVNIKATKEFVINVVSEAQANQMHESSKSFANGTDEFELASVKTADSQKVQPLRVAESPVNMECKLERIIPVGANHLVLGRLVCYHISDEVYLANDKVNPHTLKPIGRMAGDYAYIRDFFSLPLKDLPQ